MVSALSWGQLPKNHGMLLIFAFTVTLFAEQTVSQTPSDFSRIKTLHIVKEIGYTNAAGPAQFDCLKGVDAMLQVAGLSVTQTPANANGILKIQLKGTALKGEYPRPLYTGASWSGTISLTTGDSELFRSTFSCGDSPPTLIRSNWTPEKPEDAPFAAALSNGFVFWANLVDLVHQGWGPEKAVKAALKAGLNPGHQVSRIGEPAVLLMLQWLNKRDDDCSIALQFFEHYKDSRSVEPLIRILTDPRNDLHSSERKVAIWALKYQGDSRAVPTLIGMLRDCLDPSPIYSAEAVEVLGELRDNRAVEPLINILKNKQVAWYVRRPVPEALGNIGDDRAIPVLEEATQDEDSMIRFSAQRVLESILKK